MKTQTTIIHKLESTWGRRVLLFAILVIGSLYIWQVNLAATAGFTMRDIERDIEEVKMEQKRLDMEVARLQSVESVASRVMMLGLVPAGEVDYIATSDAVALR